MSVEGGSHLSFQVMVDVTPDGVKGEVVGRRFRLVSGLVLAVIAVVALVVLGWNLDVVGLAAAGGQQ